MVNDMCLFSQFTFEFGFWGNANIGLINPPHQVGRGVPSG